MDCDLVGKAVDDLLFEMEGFTEAGGAGVGEGLEVTLLLEEGEQRRGGEEGREDVLERRNERGFMDQE